MEVEDLLFQDFHAVCPGKGILLGVVLEGGYRHAFVDEGLGKPDGLGGGGRLEDS
jgi:hypothetical protein